MGWVSDAWASILKGEKPPPLPGLPEAGKVPSTADPRPTQALGEQTSFLSQFAGPPGAAAAKGLGAAALGAAAGKGLLKGTVEEAGTLFNRIVKAGDMVSDLAVHSDIPNLSSIESSLTNYTPLSGTREVPISAFEASGSPKFYSAAEEKRTRALANKIQENGEIKPLIVVVEQHDPAAGPYILEGGHRFDALKLLGKKSFPAHVVIDHGEEGAEMAGKDEAASR
jgi:hypothetical protein